jgi:hypothetical protein
LLVWCGARIGRHGDCGDVQGLSVSDRGHRARGVAVSPFCVEPARRRGVDAGPRAQNSHQPTRIRERVMKRFASTGRQRRRDQKTPNTPARTRSDDRPALRATRPSTAVALAPDPPTARGTFRTSARSSLHLGRFPVGMFPVNVAVGVAVRVRYLTGDDVLVSDHREPAVCAADDVEAGLSPKLVWGNGCRR